MLGFIYIHSDYFHYLVFQLGREKTGKDFKLQEWQKCDLIHFEVKTECIPTIFSLCIGQ